MYTFIFPQRVIGAWNKIWDLELQLKRKCGSPLQELPFGCKRRRRTNRSREEASHGCVAVMSILDLGLNSPWALGLQLGSKSLASPL